MPQDERGYLILPHELATGADCDGCLTVVERGDMVEIKCNSCGAVVDTVPIERAGTRLMELASVEICSAQCPHCGATNVFRGYTVIKVFVCEELLVDRTRSRRIATLLTSFGKDNGSQEGPEPVSAMLSKAARESLRRPDLTMLGRPRLQLPPRQRRNPLHH